MDERQAFINSRACLYLRVDLGVERWSKNRGNFLTIQIFFPELCRGYICIYLWIYLYLINKMSFHKYLSIANHNVQENSAKYCWVSVASIGGLCKWVADLNILPHFAQPNNVIEHVCAVFLQFQILVSVQKAAMRCDGMDILACLRGPPACSCTWT